MSENINPTVTMENGLPRTSDIPSAIIDSNLLSPTARADQCFIYQRFSNKLQGFLIGYTYSIGSEYSVYK